MAGPAYFNAFRDTCETHLKPWEYDAYCEPLRARAETAYKVVEPAADWLYGATAPIVNHAKWSWNKAGEHFGPSGQLILVALVIGIAYNLYGRSSANKAKMDCVSRDELARLMEQMSRNPNFGPSQPSKSAASAA